MRPVTDPAILKQLERKPVSDPAILAQLEGSDRGVLGEVQGAAETAATVLSGVIAEPASGIAGLAATPFVGARRGAQIVGEVSEGLTYSPGTPEGRRNLLTAAKYLQPVADILQRAEQASGDLGYDVAGPVGGALASTLPAALVELLGLKGARAISKVPNRLPHVGLDDTPSVQDFKAVSHNLRQGNAQVLAEGANPDPNILRAAEELKIDLNPGASSQNRAFIEAEQSLKSRPGSQIGAVEERSIRQLGERADSFINDVGGTTDKSLLDAQVREDFDRVITDLEGKSNELFQTVESAVGPATEVAVGPVKRYINDKLRDLGGDASLLTSAEKRLLALSEEGRPTYAALDRVRRDVGDAFGKRTGIYADDEIGTLKQVYGVLGEAQQQAANRFNVGDAYRAGNDLVIKRKTLEGDSVKLFGRDLSRSLVATINAAGNGLAKGDLSSFHKLMSAVPKNMRGEVAGTVLGDVFSSGSRNKAGLGGGFVKAYEGLQRNQTAKKALFRYLPEGAEQRFDMLGTVATGVYRAKAFENTSKTARDIISAMDDGRLFERVYSVSKHAAAAEAVTTSMGAPGFGAVGVVANAVGKARTPAVEAADALLASDKFRTALKTAAVGRTDAAEKLIQESQGFKRWAKYASPGDLSQITARGFIPWAIGSSQLTGNDDDLK